MRWVSLAFLVSMLAPAAAAAQGQTCVLLPPPAESAAPADAHARVDATITDELRTHELVVMASRDAQLRMADQPMEGCSAIDCAPEVNRFLGTTFAVLTELTWLRGRPTMINVVLIGLDSGMSAGGQAVIEHATDLEAAVRSAFSMAWDRWQADNQGTLVIDSMPAGAFVEIDGHSAGHAPARQRVNAGVHSVRVALEGYVTATQEVTVDRQQERALTITLASSTEPVVVDDMPAVVDTYEDQPNAWNWVIGGLALGGAIALAVPPIWTATTQGEYTTRPDGTTDTVVFGPESIAYAIGSGVLALGSIVFMLIHPFTDRVRVGTSGTGLRLEGVF